MKDWLLPAVGALVFWGLWGFIPKITTQYISPQSAIIYEVGGGMVVAAIALFVFKVEPEFHLQGMGLAIATGTLGFSGAFCFLVAVSRGPVTLVSTVSALYPLVSITLAVTLLHESVSIKQGIGIALALVSIALIAI